MPNFRFSFPTEWPDLYEVAVVPEREIPVYLNRRLLTFANSARDGGTFWFSISTEIEKKFQAGQIRAYPGYNVLERDPKSGQLQRIILYCIVLESTS